MNAIRRLLTTLIVILLVEGMAGSAVAGLTIEAEMDPWTAALLIFVGMMGSGIFTLGMLLWVVTRGRACKSPIVRAVARMFVMREQEDILEQIRPLIDYCAVRVAREQQDGELNTYK